MRAHLVQFDIAWEDKAANHRAVRRLLSRAAIARGDLVLLPEMFDTGFSLHVERTHDGAGVTGAFLSSLSAELGAYVQGGWTRLADDGRGRNHMTCYDPEGRIACDYAKIHPFSFGREAECFVGGDRVETWRWDAGADALIVCPAVCYDLRFPELFRFGMLAGAEVIALGANWPDERQAHWAALLRARAIENQAYVLAVNRTGSDPHLNYAGGTAAFDPRGDCLGELSDEEAVLSVPVSASALREWRAEFPAWRDVRLISRAGGAPRAGIRQERTGTASADGGATPSA